MKILLATDAFAPQISGVVTTLMAYERELTKLGHSVLFIEPNQFFNIPTPGYKEIPISFPTNIEKRIISFQPDAIHIHTEGPIGLTASKVCRKLKVPYTTGYATHFAEMVEKKYYIPQKLTWQYLKRHHNKATRTIVATDALVTELHAQGIKKAVACGKGVDVTLFNSSLRDYNFIPFTKPIWLYVGRISVEKNLEEFLILNLPGTKVCVGRGPELDRYKKAYKDVEFVGHKEGAELAQWYASSDVFVFPSKWDTFGLVMLEATATGTPVAALPVRGPQQAVKHGVSGWLSDNLRDACVSALRLERNKVENYTKTTFAWKEATQRFVDNLEVIDWRGKFNWSENK